MLLVAAGAVTAPASAAIIFDNHFAFPPDPLDTPARIDDGYAVAAGFRMPAGAAYELTSVTALLTASGPVTSFSAQLFGDGGAGPVGPALVSFIAPPIAVGTATDYTMAPQTPFTLQPAKTYWLVIRGQVPSADHGLGWVGREPLPEHVGTGGVATATGFRQDTLDPPQGPPSDPRIRSFYRVEGIPLPSIPALGLSSQLALIALLALIGLAAVRTS